MPSESREEYRVVYEFNPCPTHPIPMEWEERAQECLGLEHAMEMALRGLMNLYHRNVRIERRAVTVGEWEELK